MSDIIMEDLLGRMMQATGAKRETNLARALGISPQALSNAKKKGAIPPAWVMAVATKYGVSLDWLYFGRGEGRRDGGVEIARSWKAPVVMVQPAGDDPWKNTKWQEAPVVGLANCGEKGWYTPNPLALRVVLPVDYPYTPDLFAVLAVGTSMQPDGIRQGYVAFCDPSVALEPGDAVYVEKTNGMASLKRYLKRDKNIVHLQGWSEPDKEGGQLSFHQEIEMADIKSLACVVAVKRKA